MKKYRNCYVEEIKDSLIIFSNDFRLFAFLDKVEDERMLDEITFTFDKYVLDSLRFFYVVENNIKVPYYRSLFQKTNNMVVHHINHLEYDCRKVNLDYVTSKYNQNAKLTWGIDTNFNCAAGKFNKEIDALRAMSSLDSVYNFLDDYRCCQEWYFAYMTGLISYNDFIRYRLKELAHNPAIIFRFGLEDLCKKYDIEIAYYTDDKDGYLVDEKGYRYTDMKKYFINPLCKYRKLDLGMNLSSFSFGTYYDKLLKSSKLQVYYLQDLLHSYVDAEKKCKLKVTDKVEKQIYQAFTTKYGAVLDKICFNLESEIKQRLELFDLLSENNSESEVIFSMISDDSITFKKKEIKKKALTEETAYEIYNRELYDTLTPKFVLGYIKKFLNDDFSSLEVAESIYALIMYMSTYDMIESKALKSLKTEIIEKAINLGIDKYNLSQNTRKGFRIVLPAKGKDGIFLPKFFTSSADCFSIKDFEFLLYDYRPKTLSDICNLEGVISRSRFFSARYEKDCEELYERNKIINQQLKMEEKVHKSIFDDSFVDGGIE